ncbi:MAG: hypothetical protein FJ005_10015 [Chloroflexi bacterium]|nr:hypothetical protein [Chloroflexota bacterium]
MTEETVIARDEVPRQSGRGDPSQGEHCCHAEMLRYVRNDRLLPVASRLLPLSERRVPSDERPPTCFYRADVVEPGGLLMPFRANLSASALRVEMLDRRFIDIHNIIYCLDLHM